MRMKFRTDNAGPVQDLVGGLLFTLFLFVLAGCGHHQPAPVEEHSATKIKRQLNSDGTYFVLSGDTLYAIAFNYGLDPQDVAKWNEIYSPYTIYPGQKLRLTAPPVHSRPDAGSSTVKISAVKTPAQATTRTVSDTAEAPQPISKSAKTPASEVKTATPVSHSADPSSWKWPASGSVLRTYVVNDPARNGLDIAGKAGQPINAAAAGQVAYSGNGLIGYGELIIIKHSEKMLSAYAHNKVRLVKEGEQVYTGQKIAEMGRNSTGEQILHFEIRVEGRPVNPLIYLPKK